MKTYIPLASVDLDRLIGLLKNEVPFTFIRFSDGETNIIRNYFFEISKGITTFKRRSHANSFPEHDTKKFDPILNANIRSDLLASAIFRKKNYFKGIPTTHNNMVEERDLMVRLNGGISEEITFADLLMNSNYLDYINKFLPIIISKKKLAIIGNFRGKLTKKISHAKYIAIQDNFFNNYEKTLNSTINQVISLPKKTVIMSSASSLSNIIGMKIFEPRPDLTFVDVGTTINTLIGLKKNVRKYHILLSKNITEKNKYIHSREYSIKW